MLEVTIAGWAATLGLIGGLVGFDLWHSHRNPRAIGMREAVGWSLFYVAVATLFGVVFALVAGWGVGTQYFAGYTVEKSLSVDNLFVFVIIMSTFAVPAEQRARLLMLGIVGALALRAMFIALGAALLGAFSLTYLLFGLAIIASGARLFRHRGRDASVNDTVAVALARRRGMTGWFLALIAIATTDLLFAFDSIPAVFGVTQHAYIVFVANAFALLGLRPLFFLVSGLLDRLVYLSAGLALILAFIGVKLVLHFAHLHNHAVPEIPTWMSLGVIATVLAITAIASYAKTRSGAEGPGRREVSARADRWPPRRSRSQMASGSAP